MSCSTQPTSSLSLQTIVTVCTAAHDRDVYLNANEPAVVKLQSQWKGYKARKAYNERKHFLNEQQPAAVKIQVIELLLGLCDTFCHW